MSSLDNLKKRLDYYGGANQEQRMNTDKLRSLKKALLYSYQAQTAILKDNREFRCLINHDKLKEDYDDKIISIPYDDICLNADKIGKTHEGIEHIGMQVGDVFTWKETNTKWIVIQEILEENAYFRGTIRKAEDEVIIDGKSYYGYLGKWSKNELWHTKKGTSWSEMGYEVVLYITKDDETVDFFHRFQKVTINGRLWEVQMVNDITSDTMLIIYLKETYINDMEDAAASAPQEISTEPEETSSEAPAIKGSLTIYPFDTKTYTIENAENGVWSLSNTKGRIVEQTSQSVTIEITTAKSGSIDLIYIRENEEDIVQTITIKSL